MGRIYPSCLYKLVCSIGSIPIEIENRKARPILSISIDLLNRLHDY